MEQKIGRLYGLIIVLLSVLLLLAGVVVGYKVGTWQYDITSERKQAYEQGRQTGWLEMYNRIVREKQESNFKKL